MAENEKASALAQKVIADIGFNPLAKPRPTGNLIKAAREAVMAKRQEEARAMAEKLVNDSIDLTEQFLKAKNQALAAIKKAEDEYLKKMGELERQIEAAMKDAAEEVVTDTADVPDTATDKTPAE